QRDAWRAEGAGLQHHHVHHGWNPRDRLPRQSLRPRSRQAPSHAGREHRHPAGARSLTSRAIIMQNTETSKTTPLQLALAWSFAGIPLLAGVIQTLLNAMKLFQ